MNINFRKTVTKTNAESALLLFVTITPPAGFADWTEPLYLVNDVLARTIEDVVYTPYALELTNADSTINSKAQLRIDDIDRIVTASFISVNEPATVSITTRIIEAGTDIMQETGLPEVTYTTGALDVSGAEINIELLQESILKNSMNSFYITPADFPGYFI